MNERTGTQDASTQPHAGAETILEVKGLKTHLHTRRGVVKAVDGVSFSLKRGETLGIVGESGSGKSMTAKSILQMEPKPAARIMEGEVWFNGEDLLRKTEEEMRLVRGDKISMILQDPHTSLNPVFNIENQIAEALRIHGGIKERTTLRTKVVELLRKVNIADPERRISDFPHQMSGGMKQRVVGAISISCAPEIIIADEPTTALDLTIQAQYLQLLRQLQEDMGVTLIFITHDFGIVAEMCDRVAVMYAGRIVEQGPVRAIFDRPSHPYTRALIDSVPKVSERVGRLYSIPGNPPGPWDKHTGCPFADRCEFADERCRSEYPPAFSGLSKDKDHTADCWRLEDPTWEPKLYSK